MKNTIALFSGKNMQTYSPSSPFWVPLDAHHGSAHASKIKWASFGRLNFLDFLEVK